MKSEHLKTDAVIRNNSDFSFSRSTSNGDFSLPTQGRTVTSGLATEGPEVRSSLDLDYLQVTLEFGYSLEIKR